jgi:hypothetical protein
MPWKECRKMDEKLKFVSRFIDGEKIAVLCREFGISRVTRLASPSQVVRRQTGALRDSRKHSRTDFLAVVKCEDHIGPPRAGQRLVGTGLPLERPANSVKS